MKGQSAHHTTCIALLVDVR